MKRSVLLDTSFFIRLLNDEDKLHKNALGYYRYYLEKDIILKVENEFLIISALFSLCIGRQVPVLI